MRTLQDVLDALSVPGVDHTAATDYLTGVMRVRRRRRASLAVGAGALTLALLTGLALSRGSDGDDVVADRLPSAERESTTTTTSEPEDDDLSVAAQTSTSMVTTTTLPFVPTTVRPASPRPATPRPAAPPISPNPVITTSVPDRPPVAVLELLTPTATVGEVVRFELVWGDSDMPTEMEPSVSFQTGDPAVTANPATAAEAECGAGGPRLGRIEHATRFTRAGTYAVSAVVTTCGKAGVATASVTVADPPSGRSVVVTTGDQTLRPETAKLSYSVEESQWVALPERDPSVDVWHDGSPATVVLLDPGAKGTMRLEFGSCVLDSPFDLSTVPEGATARVHVEGAC